MSGDHIIPFIAIGAGISAMTWWSGKARRKKEEEEYKKHKEWLAKMTPEERDKEFEKFRDIFKDPSK